MKLKKRRYKILLIVTLIFCYLFRVPSNLHFVFDNKGLAYNFEIEHQKLLYKNNYVEISQINLRRKNAGLVKRIYSKISRPKLFKIVFLKNDNNFSVSLDKNGSTSRKNIKQGNNFSLNSSFYDTNFKYRGEVIVNDKIYSKKTSSSGYFKVINGKAIVGPKSLFDTQKGTVNFSCQAHPSIMKNGVIWNYIINDSESANYLKTKTYRSLSGINKDGNITFIVSGNGGLISIKEAAIIAKTNEIRTATMLDAGSALQYNFSNEEFNLNFSSLNNQINLGEKVDKVFRKYFGKRFFNKSPVFINYTE